MLWVNLIMDTLASLALATEMPTEDLLNRQFFILLRFCKYIFPQEAIRPDQVPDLSNNGEEHRRSRHLPIGCSVRSSLLG